MNNHPHHSYAPQQQPTTPAPPLGPRPVAVPPPPRRKFSKVAWGILLVVVLVLGGFAVWSGKQFFLAPHASASQYQAVFLANGQVYFGKISDINANYVTLNDIYYLQVVQSLQGQTQANQPLSLIKLGNELHGPTDTMHINRSQILFYEDLRPDSGVVKKIQDYKAANPAQAPGF